MENNTQTRKGYRAPDGNWYETPQEELNFEKSCVAEAQDMFDAYHLLSNIVFKPSLVYMGLRGIGRVMGVGPEIDPAEPFLIDAIAGIAGAIGGVCKLSELVCKLSLKGAIRDYQSAVERLSQNSEISLLTKHI